MSLRSLTVYTPVDPEAPENLRAINIAFVTGSVPDIGKKPQRLEGFEGKALSELTEVAGKVFNNQKDPHDFDSLEETKKDKFPTHKDQKHQPPLGRKVNVHIVRKKATLNENVLSYKLRPLIKVRYWSKRATEDVRALSPFQSIR